MAGLKAGLNYPTYPTMNGEWLPNEMWDLDGLFNNFLNNKATVQFIHRLIPIILGIFIFIFLIHKTYYKKYYFSNTLNQLSWGLVAVYFGQFALGIITVINCKGYVPVLWGVAHQMGAIVLLTICLLVNTRLGKGSTG